MTTSTTQSVATDRNPKPATPLTRLIWSQSILCLALFGCLLTAGPAMAYPPAIPNNNISSNSITPKMDEEIDKHFAEKKLPGLVVLYSRDGLLTYKRSLGYSDVENQVKMTEHRVGRLNSVSKWVAGIISMQQVEKGNFNLNAAAKSYLPDLPDHHTYKVKDLLSCRSGVPYYSEAQAIGAPAGWDNDHYDSATEAAPMIWNDPLVSPVGLYHYSTRGYTILGACLEQGAHESISDIIQTDLNQKFGLSTLAAEDVTTSNSQRMKLYTWNRPNPLGKFRLGRNIEVERGDHSWKVLGGGIESSPMDLLRLGILLGDGKIISPANVQLMMKRIDPLESYALGCTSVIENGYHVMSKSGSWKGSNAYIWLVPEERMVMVVMANRDEADVSGLAAKLRSIILAGDKASGNKPDFVVENFKKTGTPQFKNGSWEIPVRFDVKNQGLAGANSSFVNGVQLGTKYRWTGFMDALPPKAADQSTGIVKIPDGGKLLAGRTLKLVAYADAPIAAADTSMPAYGRVDESNDSNNTATLNVTLPGGLDIGLTGQKPTEPVLPGTSNPTRVPPTNTPPKRVQIAVPQATFVPPTRPTAPPARPAVPPQRFQIVTPQATIVPPSRPATPRPTRVPSTNLPTIPARPVVLRKSDLEIRAIRFVPNQPQQVFVVVLNAGNGPAPANVLRLTVRKIGNSAVARTTDVNVPALAAGASKVLTVDTSSILPNAVALKSTMFRVDADFTKVVSESDETNNLEWHKP